MPRVNVTCPSNVPIFDLPTGPVALWTIPFCMEGGVPTTQATCDSAPLADLTPGITTVTCTCEGAGVFSASCSFAIVVDGKTRFSLNKFQKGGIPPSHCIVSSSSYPHPSPLPFSTFPLPLSFPSSHSSLKTKRGREEGGGDHFNYLKISTVE